MSARADETPARTKPEQANTRTNHLGARMFDPLKQPCGVVARKKAFRCAAGQDR